MKRILLMVALLMTIFTSVASAEYVRGYTRRDGTSVQGYNRSDSNDTVRDNYSYKGNYNPYNGQEGTNYYRHSPSSEYYDGSSRRRSNSDWNSN